MSDMAYVAYCKCGKLIFAAVDSPDHGKDNAKDIAKFVRDGFPVNRITCESVRAGEWCKNHGNCK
jgi:hypothetical protein